MKYARGAAPPASFPPYQQTGALAYIRVGKKLTPSLLVLEPFLSLSLFLFIVLSSLLLTLAKRSERRSAFARYLRDFSVVLWQI